MTNIMSAPIIRPIKVPIGPATGRKVVPGITNAPQPTLHPNPRAQAPTGD